jgi:methionine sulfoxide reductase heme-binding subunit
VTRSRLASLKAAAWIACLTPLLRLGYKGFNGGLGANPIEYVTLSTGKSTLVILVVTLAVTPLRRVTGLNWLTRFRRLTGLFAFFYGCLHLTTYVWLDKFFDVGDIVKDIARRPFITAGTLAFFLMVPLALTSTRSSIQRLGRKWQILHRLIYPSAAAAAAHFWWKQKADIREPAIYAAIVAGLLLVRLLYGFRRVHRTGAAAATSESK